MVRSRYQAVVEIIAWPSGGAGKDADDGHPGYTFRPLVRLPGIA